MGGRLGQLSCTPVLMVVRKHQAKRAVNGELGESDSSGSQSSNTPASQPPPSHFYVCIISFTQSTSGTGLAAGK